MNIKLDHNQKLEIKELFDLGHSTKDIASKFAVSRTTVRQVINVLGGKFKSSSDTNRKYSLNEDCFGNFETEDSLYFFGLLLGDGNISKDRPRIKIGLQKCDKEILDKFAEFLGSDRPLKAYKNNYSLVIDSVRISEILLANNFEPCKSTRERIPKFYNREDINMRHFWRGLIDADGSLFISKDQKEHLNLISSIEVINEFEAFVKFHTGISMTSVQQHTTTKDCYYANYYCRNALTVADMLYKDSSIFLQRKFEKYEELMSKEHRFIKKDLDRYVSYIKSQNVYKVYIDIPANKFRGKTKVYLGRFKNIEDARKVRDEFVILLRGLQSE